MATIFGVSSQSVITPYSRYGYGLLRDNATSAQRTMGGVGYAMNSGRQINVMNPASYAAIDTLTFLFDMGIDFTALKSTEYDNKGKSFGGGLDYITLQFPIGKYMGASIGAMPFASTGYSFGDEVVNGTNSHIGSGDLNQLYLGLSGRLFKGFSVGATFSYLFGTIINDAYAYTSSGSTTLFERVMRVRDWRVDVGVQYSLNFNKKNRATVGVVYSPGKTLLGHAWGIYYDVNNDSEPDTVGYTALKDKYTLPDTWGAGISYEWDNRLLAEVDFTYQGWKNAKYTAIESFEEMHFDNRWKAAAGLQFTPMPRGDYMERVQYRVGAFFNHDYLMVGDNNVRDFGVSAGLGLPVNGYKTVLNVGFEYRRRQAYPETLIKENYFNITVGINFNEMWFWQNKIK